VAFKIVNQTVIDLDGTGATQIQSAAGTDIALYPDQNIWIKEGTKLIFEGTLPDAFEAKLQATTLTADRDLILPDGDGTLATEAYVTSVVTGGALVNTDGLAEGLTNLYYTTARANTDIDTRLATKSTTDLTEGTNLYYTDTRSRSAISVSGDLAYNSATGVLSFSAAASPVISVNSATGSVVLDTDDIAEGSTNLYYTDARVQAKIDAVVDSAPAALDTLNELAAALGDDPNFATTVTTALAGKLPLAGGTMTGTLVLNGAPTATNHAATKAYVDSAIVSGGLSNTDSLSEGSSNLYFTNARARTHIEGADLNLGTNKILYSNVYATAANLPAASSYHGMFAHVHDVGKAYFAHAGGWQEIVAPNTSSGLNIQFNSIGAGTAASGAVGDIRATADVTAYYSSDASLKENVINIENALDKVKKIRGVEFDWTADYIETKGGEDGYFVRKHDVGVIAQEVEAVLPEVVGTRDDGIKAVRYDRIVALLIEAIKEQQTQIEELNQRLNQY